MSTPDELLLEATCAVRDVDDKVIGTGWLLDDDGHVLTAGHVLGRDTLRDEVLVTFQDDTTRHKATRLMHAYDAARGIDCAILELTGFRPKRRALAISLGLNANGDFKLFGYGATLGNVSPAVGKILGSYLVQDQSAFSLLSLSSDQSNEGGYSGAAIFSHKSAAVVGIQIEGADVKPGTAHSTTVLAMPIYRIAQLFNTLPVFANAMKQQGEADYEYHVYLSYRRGSQEEKWLDTHFLGELREWLGFNLTADRPTIFYDHNDKRSAWNPVVVDAIRRSRCLVAIASPGYWHSPECVAELETFRQRQKLANKTLALGVVFGGDEPSIKEVKWENFTDYAKTYKGYSNSGEYGYFEDATKKLSERLAHLIADAPEFDVAWPVITPGALGDSSAHIDRPRL